MVESVRYVDKHENYDQKVMLIIVVMQRTKAEMADRISSFEIMSGFFVCPSIGPQSVVEARTAHSEMGMDRSFDHE